MLLSDKIYGKIETLTTVLYHKGQIKRNFVLIIIFYKNGEWGRIKKKTLKIVRFIVLSFYNIIRVSDIDFILIYDNSYKILMGAISLCTWFNEFIKIFDKIRYLVLFGHSWFDKICNRIKYLMSEKNGTTDGINHNFKKIRTDSYDSLPVEEIVIFQI